MRLRRLHTKNVRGVPDGAYTFPASATAVVITGPGGSGKSSLLRAVAAARRALAPLGGPLHAHDFLATGATEGLLRAEWEHGAETFDVSVAFGPPRLPDIPPALAALADQEADIATFDLVPAGRRLDTGRMARLWTSSPGAALEKRFSDDGDKYGRVWSHLSAAVTGAATSLLQALEERGVVYRQQLPDGLDRYKRAVAAMCPGLRLTRVEPRGELRPLVWFERADRSRVEVGELPDSEAQGFLLASVFAACATTGSMMLIDGPELHMRPKEHKRHFRAMRDLAADGQLIVASTSPEILECVAPQEILDLESFMREPREPRNGAAARSSSQPIARAPSTQTTAVDVSKILQPVVPFEPSPAGLAAGRPVARFDPQTGQPLAQPCWQDLDAPEKMS